MNGWADIKKHRKIDGWKDRQDMFKKSKKKEFVKTRQTDRQTDEWTGRKIDGWND